MVFLAIDVELTDNAVLLKHLQFISQRRLLNVVSCRDVSSNATFRKMKAED